MKFVKPLLIALGILTIISCSDTKNEISKKEYESAVSFMYTNYNNKTAFNLFTDVYWFNDDSGIWFVDHSSQGKTYRTVNFKDGEVKDLFDATKLAKSLAKYTEKEVDSNRLSLSEIQRTENGIAFKWDSKEFELNLQTYQLTEKAKEKKASNNPYESTSPDGKWVAYTKNYNLFIKSTKTKRVYQLSKNGKRGYEYASWYGWYDKMEGENGERPKRFYVNWSKDSKWIATSVVDTRNAEKMYLLDWSIDSLYKPKLLSYYRGSPGDTTMVHLTPVFFNVQTKREVKTKLPTATHINSVNANWSETSGVAFASYAERGYLKQYVKEVDLNKRTERTLIEETSDTGIDNFDFRPLEKKGKIIFLSERSGWRQMYILDIKTGQIKPLTEGSYYVNSIQYIDEENETVYFLASGKETENNLYHQQLYKVNFGGEVTLLTPEKTHHIINFSKNGAYFVDNYSTIQIPTKTVLREAATGTIVAELTQADISDATSRGYKVPEVFSTTAKDGKTTIYGAYWKPTNFDASKSYPIIDATYTGPHTQRFPKSFGGVFSNQSLAELGFIVVRVDGLGTSGRSKEFHDHSYKNMGNNLEDHVLAIKYLAKEHSWIDGDRVGIYGHSAGGFDTGRALLTFPNFYKVGVASSADHDFRMEKAWWPEMYQGWPVDETYEEVSNITNAKNLKGKLLITHGGLDDNVNPSATFKLAEALIKADKDFDLLILPSQRHGYQGDHRLYFIKKRWNYFVKNLRGTEPIWNFEWE
ncbi:prolyl oligopeptidase family serine peptidase [Flavobacteriaceae bacterium S356]|uniref:Prolyl oligopeptidase family serine peptidase n=1 Tax=Asprobacillus argus TaxID=3076534 RepID=A0ABU3LF45_9FLAO|nr:prolyl oligopeptidase family serine peptidase [Flavobacteriaceae bacterium S356]